MDNRYIPTFNCEYWLQSLSDENHFEGEDKSQHNLEYDHDAFLGKEEAKSFDELSPDESRRRLGLVNKFLSKVSNYLLLKIISLLWSRPMVLDAGTVYLCYSFG